MRFLTSFERYEIVIDNYKRGVYGIHDPLRGSWRQSQGELMQIMGDIDATRKALNQDVRKKGEEVEASIRAFRADLHEQIHEQIKEAGEDLWEILDRYL